MELLQEIASYWTTRTEGYSRVNQKELTGEQRRIWREVLTEHFPRKEKGELSILDVGTGPGFFPIILAEAGYQVTAVDYTPGMLEKARENAGALGSRIRFVRMDAQALEFPDRSFDVVLSRNLTWNLEEPARAYAEWFRVLKPGGVLLNFDANWYTYLYDERQRAGYEADRARVEGARAEDYYLGTDIGRMERIALQMPLSAQRRPVWDEKVLGSIGFSEVAVDLDIWQRVWSEEEKLNSASTPMFLIKAVRPCAVSRTGRWGRSEEVDLRRPDRGEAMAHPAVFSEPERTISPEADSRDASERTISPDFSTKERVKRYWSRRSGSFLAQKRSELHSVMAERWMEEIHRYLPGDRKLAVLDVGCGAGFFSILLAKEGHSATGLDLTPEMVEVAALLAREEGAECRFLVGDAENLDFPENSFDLVISRNLTWTLPDAAHAYQEWNRVLRPGGILLNLDADYGADNSMDTSKLPPRHAHDALGREMLAENEAIKGEMAISRCRRPAWDIQVLEGLGMEEVQADEGVSGRVYREKDEFYNPAPMFLLRGGKSGPRKAQVLR